MNTLLFVLLNFILISYIICFDFATLESDYKHPHRRLDAKWDDVSKNLKQKYKDSMNTNRKSIVQKTIESVAGIYHDNSKISKFKTGKTVLVTVVSSNIDNQHVRYHHLLNNWFCFANHFGLRPLTYLVPAEGKNFTEQVQDLHSIGIFGDFMTYPDELFYSYVSNKSTVALKGFGKVDYAGDLPSFNHFGALVMLIPILEVLQHGYDAIYIDLDVGFVYDPIPQLIKGNSDFSVSIEMKTCYCPSVQSIARLTDWKGQEPNTGIMRVRSTPKALEIFHHWLRRNVEENVSNDQKVLNFMSFGARIAFDCNDQLNPISDELMDIYNKSLLPSYQFRKDELASMPRYCYYNEYLFQNGKIALHCAFNRGGSAAEYMRAMDHNNFTYWNDTSQSYEKTYAPTIVHMNFCDDKIASLDKLGMWLPVDSTDFQSSSCRRYRYEDTIYGKSNWVSKIASANEELGRIENMIYNGSVIKLHRWPIMYLIHDGKFRVIPNGETLEALGLDWKKVHYPGPYNMLKSFPAGDPLPDLKVYAPTP